MNILIPLGEISIKEEYAKLIPPLPAKDYQELKKSIQNDGLYYPIIVNDKGQILDGHHRFKACHELGRNPKYDIMSFEDPLKERKFVIKSNFNRRHLEMYQRLELANELHKIEEEERRAAGFLQMGEPVKKRKRAKDTRKRKRRDPSLKKIYKERTAVHKAAKQAHVSPTSLKRYQDVLKRANPQITEQVKTGRMTTNRALKVIQNEELQKKLLAQVPAPILPQGFKLENYDFFEYSQDNIKDNSIDLIFTDPPYGLETIPIYEALAKEAERILKPGASIVTYVGTYTLDQIMANFRLATGLKFWWIFCIKHAGAHAQMYQRRLFIDWKPLLWYVKGDDSTHAEPPHDLIESEIPDKSIHPWAQSPKEARYIISKFTKPNAIILDPFTGSGTTGIAAMKLGRQFIGCEVDKTKYDLAKATLAKLWQELKNEIH